MDKEYTIFTDSNISSDSEPIRVAFYANIGYFIQIVQMLEFNLRKLICYVQSVNEIESGDITKERVDGIHQKYDEYYLKTYKDKFTLGLLMNEVSRLGIFKPQIITSFKEINDYRINVVHMMFQNNIISNKFGSSDNVLEYMTKRLAPMTNKSEALNKFVIQCIETYKEDFRKYVKEASVK